jgi:hypothetical protein
MVDGRDELRSSLRFFEDPLILDFRHVVGVVRISRKGVRIFEVLLRHDIRYSHAVQEGFIEIAEHESATFFRRHVERMATEIVEQLARNRHGLERGVQFGSIRHDRSHLKSIPRSDSER